jgi:hypothetical protein
MSLRGRLWMHRKIRPNNKITINRGGRRHRSIVESSWARRAVHWPVAAGRDRRSEETPRRAPGAATHALRKASSERYACSRTSRVGPAALMPVRRPTLQHTNALAQRMAAARPASLPAHRRIAFLGKISVARFSVGWIRSTTAGLPFSTNETVFGRSTWAKKSVSLVAKNEKVAPLPVYQSEQSTFVLLYRPHVSTYWFALLQGQPRQTSVLGEWRH